MGRKHTFRAVIEEGSGVGAFVNQRREAGLEKTNPGPRKIATGTLWPFRIHHPGCEAKPWGPEGLCHMLGENLTPRAVQGKPSSPPATRQIT